MAHMLMVAAAAVEGPPNIPPMWTGVPTANYTMPGYDAGTLNIRFYSDCSQGPSLQRMKTVYPDNYTVLTYCDKGYQYTLGKNGFKAPACEVWPVYPGNCDVCSCPYCVRQDADGTWGSQGAGAVTWTSGHEAATSPVTGESVLIWRGTQANGNLVEHSVAINTTGNYPVTQYITSPDYLSIGTYFKHFADTFDPSVFDEPSICPALPTEHGGRGAAEPEAEALEEVHASRQLGTESHAATLASTPPPSARMASANASGDPAPALPLRLSAVLISNISQPGYEGGNVKTAFTADCSRGPQQQVISTTYGNFHTVLVNCSAGVVYNYDLAGIDCDTVDIGVGVDRRICETCALPFGVRSTAGIYRTGSAASQVFTWRNKTVRPSGETTYHGVQGGLELNFTFGPDGTPLAQNTTQPGWQSVMIAFSEYTTSIDASLFVPPVCFSK